MEIAFAIAAVLGFGIGEWLAHGPYCPKHIFTKLKRGETVEKEMPPLALGLFSERTAEVEWICPKCGYTEKRTEKLEES